MALLYTWVLCLTRSNNVNNMNSTSEQSPELLRNLNHKRQITTVFPGIILTIFKDRKSTRLNSSHTVISYAVFCLKKKNHRFGVANEHHLLGRLCPSDELEEPAT